MNTLLVIASLLSLGTLGVNGAGANPPWGYENAANVAERPGQWKDSYPLCEGTNQSPIGLMYNQATYNANLGAFTLTGYSTAGAGMISMNNNGHTAYVAPNVTGVSVSGGGLPRTYDLKQFHVHWGSVSSQGSEHTLDQTAYAAEIHFVHQAADIPDRNQAINYTDGYTVLGTFVEASASYPDNAQFAKFADLMQNITYKDSEVMVESFPLDAMLPTDRTKYYRYMGSLTTPPCLEVVVWTVFKDPIRISENQMATLRTLVNVNATTATGAASQSLNNCYRPLMPLGSRTVYRSFADVTTTPTSGATSLTAFFTGCWLAAILALVAKY